MPFRPSIGAPTEAAPPRRCSLSCVLPRPARRAARMNCTCPGTGPGPTYLYDSGGEGDAQVVGVRAETSQDDQQQGSK